MHDNILQWWIALDNLNLLFITVTATHHGSHVFLDESQQDEENGGLDPWRSHRQKTAACPGDPIGWRSTAVSDAKVAAAAAGNSGEEEESVWVVQSQQVVQIEKGQVESSSSTVL